MVSRLNQLINEWINALINELKPLISDIGDATMIVPLIKEYMELGIKNDEAKQMVESKNIFYISNKCIKQEYQRLFLNVSPVFPALKN